MRLLVKTLCTELCQTFVKRKMLRDYLKQLYSEEGIREDIRCLETIGYRQNCIHYK
jgi:hypothetical protein